MAKARKTKNADDSKQENSGAVVRHQKLCLSIDLDTRRIYGYTELEIAVPDIGIVGLHAENLGISRVLVDGEPTEFEHYPLHQNAENGRIWSSVTSSNSAADVASSLYLSALQKELETNLLINCCKAFKAENELPESVPLENGSHSSGEAKQNVKLVRIDYWVEKAESGVHFDGNVLHTDNQMRRARCWFPCMDVNSQRCCYDMEFTVAQNLVAVSSGNLLYQVLSKDDPPRKTYVYKIDYPISASWIALAVAPFQILPDSQNALLSHMCLPPNIMKLQNTVGFFYTAFSYYEDYLEAKFPFGSYKQVFIAPEMAVSPMSLGVSVSIFSSKMLYDEKVIDKTIDTRIKLALALAKQWFGVFITAASPDDEWLLDGLASYLTDSFIKKQLGNNEARYRRFKANCAVCRADDSGATTLSCSASCKDLYGTQSIGLYGKIRSWKSVAILQMLEKQMGPETFCKILQTIVSRGLDTTNPSRTLSTKEFRHLANKVGNLDRPFLKKFFLQWVESCGCPVLRIGFSYNKRKNIAEVAVLRGCTARPEAEALHNASTDSEVQQTDVEWPRMMSIRVNDLDGMFDTPSMILAGESLQLVEIPCRSRLSGRRLQKSKKGPKADGSDDNGDAAVETRPSSESPLLWVRADPEMEYLAEIHLNQPVQMWINQLEKDKDVVAQAQAISILEMLPLAPFSVVNALNNFLSDSKAFWRVRIEAAFALANIASEETDCAGLVHLLKFYRSRRFDAEIGLPKPNDFRDIPEYFVLEAIPRAVAVVRAADGKSPREAVEFVLQLLKYNDNNGNIYSDVFWLATLIESVGELEFGQQTVVLLPSLLKRIDRILQFDRLMPSYNGTLTISCIRALSRIALKLSDFIPLDQVIELITPFRDLKTIWLVRIEASRALLDLEFQYRGLDAALSLFIKYLEEEPSLRGQVKLSVHVMRLCQISGPSDFKNDLLRNTNLVALLRLLEGRMAFNNISLRHYLFCILQILAGRAPTLYGAPRDKTLPVGDAENGGEQKNIFRAFISELKPLTVEPKVPEPPPPVDKIILPEPSFPEPSIPEPSIPEPSLPEPFYPEPSFLEVPPIVEAPAVPQVVATAATTPEVIITKDADTVSSSHEQKRSIVKIKVKRSTPSDNQTVEKSVGGGGGMNEPDRGASSSVSVDAPQRNNFLETATVNLDEVNSCHDPGWGGSRMTVSIGSDNLGRELQCTADSSKVSTQSQSMNNIEGSSMATDVMEYGPSSVVESKEKDDKKKKKKKDKEERKRRRDDPEYMEKKRLKKEKKRREKELAKLKNQAPSSAMAMEEEVYKEPEAAAAAVRSVTVKPSEGSNAANVVITKVEAIPRAEGSAPPRFKIKIKNRTLSKS